MLLTDYHKYTQTVHCAHQSYIPLKLLDGVFVLNHNSAAIRNMSNNYTQYKPKRPRKNPQSRNKCKAINKTEGNEIVDTHILANTECEMPIQITKIPMVRNLENKIKRASSRSRWLLSDYIRLQEKSPINDRAVKKRGSVLPSFLRKKKLHMSHSGEDSVPRNKVIPNESIQLKQNMNGYYPLKLRRSHISIRDELNVEPITRKSNEPHDLFNSANLTPINSFIKITLNCLPNIHTLKKQHSKNYTVKK